MIMLRIVCKQNFDFKLVPEIVFGLFPLDKWLIHSGWWNNILVLIYEDILGMSPGNNFSIIRIYRLSFQKRFDWTKWFMEFFLFAKYYPENCCDFLIIIKNSWWMMTISLLKAFSIFSWLEKMNFNTLSISLELISIAWYRFLIWFEHSEVMKNTVFWVFLFITDEKQEKEKSYFFTVILRKLLINELESFWITFIMIVNCSTYFFFLKMIC